MASHISGERRTAFYLGTLLMVLGGILFATTLVSVATGFGDPLAPQGGTIMYRAFSGMALLIAGSFLRRMGARGLAGAGLVLDPERARQDLEPFSRMAGGMVQDALDETRVQLGTPSEKVVMVKCRACATLNAEDAKYCKECGKAL